MAKKASRRGFGNIRQLPSGRWQVRYRRGGQMHLAPITFDASIDAEAWLARQRAEMIQGTWLPPQVRKNEAENYAAGVSQNQAGNVTARVTFGEYAYSWLATRRGPGGRPLAATTREHYAQLLRDHILPAFGVEKIINVTPAAVRSWHASTDAKPTAKAHAYGLLRTILATAVADEVIASNPCRVRGAGSGKRAKTPRPASLSELETIAAAVPPRYRLMVLFGAWCALRFGELAELRRSDIDVKNAVVHVRRGVTRSKNGPVVGGPKSEAGKRDVAIPPHLMPLVKAHLRDHTGLGKDALMFPARSGRHMVPASLYRVFYPAREAAGRPDLRFHDLRHTGATLAAVTGATLAELMARLGHSTPQAAMRYQHAAADRDRVIAAALSDLANGGTVTPIRKRKAK